MTNSTFSVNASDGRELVNQEFPLHPGYIIEMEIEARKLKKQDVAKELGIKPGHLSELLKEKRHVSAMLAIKLERLFDLEADFWVRVQGAYDLIKARKKLISEA